MDTIENQTARGITIYMDGKRFICCSFTECILVYGGSDCVWVDSMFANCTIRLDGPADRTATFLRGFGWTPPKSNDRLIDIPIPTSGPVN